MKFFNFYFFATILIILCACKKEESFNDENQIQIEFSKETVLATCFYSKICQISLNELKYIKLPEEIISDQIEVNSAHDSCAIVSYSLDTGNNFIQQLNIIYNDTNCNSIGRRKFGKLKVYLTGLFDKVGTKITIIPEAFFIDNKKVEGTIIISNLSSEEDYINKYKKEVIDGKICIDNDYFTWQGYSFISFDYLNEELTYEIQANVISINGRPYELETMTPLVTEFNCLNFKSGELELKSNWGLAQELDFGNGDCDNKGQLLQGNKVVEIKLIL